MVGNMIHTQQMSIRSYRSHQRRIGLWVLLLVKEWSLILMPRRVSAGLFCTHFTRDGGYCILETTLRDEKLIRHAT